MSGGHYEYLCFRVRDFAEIMETQNNPKRVKFQKLMELVADACRAIEWEDSGDTGPEHTAEKIDAVFNAIFLNP
jgi:hypothetical protein